MTKIKQIDFSQKGQFFELALNPKISKKLLISPEATEEEKTNFWNRIKNKVFVYQDNQKILGFIAFEKMGLKKSHVLKIINIAVSPEFQKKGIGTELLNHAIKNNPKIKRLELTCYANNKSAISFYKKFGFKKEGVGKKALQYNDKFVNEIYLGYIIPGHEEIAKNFHVQKKVV